ncbi:MAG: TerC family protein [Syntrophobacteraceae bacterium]
MDLGILGNIEFTWGFLYSVLSIVIIDLVLAGDNAVVIAMAVKSLPAEQRKKGIALGAGAAVLLRLVITFFVAQALQISYLKLAGGILILWIAVKLLADGAHEEETGKQAGSMLAAVKIIVVADITMSLDNMLAVGGASHGNVFLLLFGLGLSIPLIVFTSSLLSSLMDRYPVIVYIGAAILGKVGGQMIITDPVVARLVDPEKVMIYTVEGLFAVAVVLAAELLIKYKARHRADSTVSFTVQSLGHDGSDRPKD